MSDQNIATETNIQEPLEEQPEEKALESLENLEPKPKKKGKKDKSKEKEKDAGRGIETMFRTSLRNHIQLSQIADNKANIMLTINGGIIAFALGSLFPRFEGTPVLVLPSSILVMFCITALIFAVISTIPKVSSGKFTKQEITDKKANLLFFGNFHKMTLEDFEWGIQQLIKDKEYLYSAMTKDFYSLGKVLSVKYKYLRISYVIFMIGMIISVLAFATAFILK
jgi:Pycsar effector protein